MLVDLVQQELEKEGKGTKAPASTPSKSTESQEEVPKPHGQSPKEKAEAGKEPVGDQAKAGEASAADPAPAAAKKDGNMQMAKPLKPDLKMKSKPASDNSQTGLAVGKPTEAAVGGSESEKDGKQSETADASTP